MSNIKENFNYTDINFLNNSQKYDWHGDPYSYYNLAKEMELPFKSFEIILSNYKDPVELTKALTRRKKSNNLDLLMKLNAINKNKLIVPIIETVMLENGQILGWFFNDKKDGHVVKQSARKMNPEYLIKYFLSQIRNSNKCENYLLKQVSEYKILSDLPGFANYIIQKGNNRDMNIFHKNNLEYIFELEKIKFILVYYYAKEDPVLINFIDFYFLLNEHGGINSIKMLQNILDCKFLSPTQMVFDSGKLNINTKDLTEENMRRITVKYSKPNELDSKKFFVFYNKPKNLFKDNPLFNPDNLNNQKTKKRFYTQNKFPKNKNKRIVLDAQKKIPPSIQNTDIFGSSEIERQGTFKYKKSMSNTITTNQIDENTLDNDSKERSRKKIMDLNTESDKALPNCERDENDAKKYKFYLKNGKKNDGKILGHMEKLENNLILQNNDILNLTMSKISEQLVKYFEFKKNIIILYAYFVFIRVSKKEDDEYYSFQKCILLYAIDKNELQVREKTYLLRKNMQNIICKRIPEDVSKFKSFEKFTKNDFCHGEFCHYIIPSYFKGIKEQHSFESTSKKIPKENKITIRDKNNELPGKMPLFEIKKIYDNPELTNLVLKAYSIFPPGFNKEMIIEKIIKERNLRYLNANDEENNQNNIKNKNNNSETNIENNNLIDNKINDGNANNNTPNNVASQQNLIDEFSDVMESSVKITRKIIEYENEFKQEIIVYRPTPGKFLHVDYNDMYTECGVCEKCYKIYTIILDFMKNIDECTAEFKSLTKAKNFLIRGESLKTNNFEDKNTNDNNLIIQEELGKMSVKKFLVIKILKTKLEELKNLQKKQRVRIDRNHVTKKQELDETFNYNLNINLRLLLANLLAEKTNNKFFNVLFNELYNEDDSVYKNLDISKPKVSVEKTNMKDLRLQMGISAQNYCPNNIAMLNYDDETKNSIKKLMKDNIKKLNEEQIFKNIQQQMCQVDKNLFQEYSILCEYDNNLNENKDSEYNNDSSMYMYDDSIDKNSNIKNNILSTIYEYFKVPVLCRIRRYSFNKNNELKNNEYNIKRYNSMKIKTISSLIKNFKNHMKKHEKLNFNRQKSKNIERKKKTDFTQLKSLEEIKRQKEKQLEEFLCYDPNKHKSKGLESENDSFFSNFSKEEEINSSDSDVVNWDKDKVALNSIYYSKTTDEYQEIHSSPYYYITTPLPKLPEINSKQRINENPLLLLQKIDLEQFKSLGNFNNENEEDVEKHSRKNSDINSKIRLSKYLLDNKFVKIYAYDKYTAVPYEILDMNNVNGQYKNMTKGKKYIVFVLNDFFDSYIKYKYFFNMSLNSIRFYNDLVLQSKIKNYNSTNNTTENNNVNNENNDKGKNIIAELKFVLFNLPGQSSTLFTKKIIQNNMYYSDFLDRFIFYLFNEKKEFDISYKIVLLGFGNGGQIALTYASLYEKYWNIFDSIIMFNAYCSNASIVNETMLEILKLICKVNNPTTIEAFIKQSTRNPNELNENDKKSKNGNNDDEEIQKNLRKFDELLKLRKNKKKKEMSYSSIKNNNNMDEYVNDITLDGYKTITKGYFYNIQINLKDISTKILCVHSNSDSFFNIHNISPLFNNDISSYNNTPLIKIFNLSEINKNNDKNKKIEQNDETGSKANSNFGDNGTSGIIYGYNLDDFKTEENYVRKLIIFDGSHDTTFSPAEKDNIIFSTLISYFNPFK